MANTASPSVHRHRNIGRYLTLTIRHPQEALAELVGDRRGRVFATLALGTVAVLYSLTEWFLYQQHYDPVPTPFLRIATEHYYAWATLFGVPTILGAGCWQPGRCSWSHGR